MLNENNRKAELSYAYLHAVAAAAGFACYETHRHLDNAGIDARIDIKEMLDPEAALTDFSVDVQLKATSAVLPTVAGQLSFPLDIGQYNKLRLKTVAIPRLIVLMTLPELSDDWLRVSPEELVARHCARWTCICGFPDHPNSTTVTVRFDVDKILTPVALREIARLIAVKKGIT